MQAVRLQAERAKIRLSEELKTTVSLDLPDEQGQFTRELTRDQLEGLCSALVERSPGPAARP